MLLSFQANAALTGGDSAALHARSLVQLWLFAYSAGNSFALSKALSQVKLLAGLTDAERDALKAAADVLLLKETDLPKIEGRVTRVSKCIERQ